MEQEDSRTQIAEDNIKDRREAHGVEIELQKKIHGEDVDQVADLKKELKRHCKQNEDRDKVLDIRDAKTEKKIDLLIGKIDGLLWLNDEETKKIIKETVVEVRGRTWLSVKLARFLKTAAIVIGILAGISGIVWGIIKGTK